MIVIWFFSFSFPPSLPSFPPFLSLPLSLSLSLSLPLQFGQEGAGYLGNVLENNKVLQQLIINNCGMGDAGIHHIAKGTHINY